MLDGQVRKWIEPTIDRIGRFLAGNGVTANSVTLTAFALGLVSAALIANTYFLAGLATLLLSRLCDGLDGSVARATRKTDLGGYLDIVLDFAFYGLIPLAFVFADPASNALPGAVLLLSFYVNGASFLAYAIMAEKRGMESVERGDKSLFFTTGLAEATETIMVFVAMCLLPGWFPLLAWLFAVICFYTAFSRVMLASRAFN